MTKVTFNNYNCAIQFGKYNNGRIALTLVDLADGSPVAVATVNLPEVDVPEGYVLIKDYSENEGMFKQLYKQGIVGFPIQFAGNISAPLCPLLIKPD